MVFNDPSIDSLVMSFLSGVLVGAVFGLLGAMFRCCFAALLAICGALLVAVAISQGFVGLEGYVTGGLRGVSTPFVLGLAVGLFGGLGVGSRARSR